MRSYGLYGFQQLLAVANLSHYFKSWEIPEAFPDHFPEHCVVFCQQNAISGRHLFSPVEEREYQQQARRDYPEFHIVGH
jgi:hypothetical protein